MLPIYFRKKNILYFYGVYGEVGRTHKLQLNLMLHISYQPVRVQVAGMHISTHEFVSKIVLPA